jgi:[CysO sulfur-carrier protein]-S-L-cysteine hydrolase
MAGYARSMLTISAELQSKIVAHARADHPDEACGVVAGPAGSDRPERFIPMLNAERSPTFYRFDSLEQLRVWREMDDRDEEPVVIYHSHTATQAYPSRTDISYASEPGAHYVLVSTRDADAAEFRSFRIVDAEVTEEEVVVTGTE